MAIKIRVSKNISVNLNTLIRLEWRKLLPVLIVHEKFENKIKWILRTIAFIGIATSIISIDKWYNSLGLSIIIFLIEQFFERTVFEYTTMVVQPYPDFEVDYNQWKTNGFMIPVNKNKKEKSYAGPSYIDKDYATQFFEYVKSWNYGCNVDKDNNIILSFIIEPNEKYSTYLYANPGRKNLEKTFKHIAEANKLNKYGKQQRKMVVQMIYWHTMPFKEGLLIKQFLDFQKNDEEFFLIPSIVPTADRAAEFIFENAILKYEYKLKHRAELTKKDFEYFYPTEK